MEIASGDVVFFNGGLVAHRVAAVAGDTSDAAMGSEAQMAPYVRLNCQVRLSLPDAARSVLRLQFVALVPGGEAPLGPAHPLHVAGQAAADPTQG